MLLDDLAKELVSFTSDLMEGRTINIMNTEGIIIASTEEHRIGSFHQGALEAARTGKPVAIEPDQLSRYPGAKQGYNMPITIEGEIIGVIGVFGNPSEIKPLARLLEVFAMKYYQLEAMSVPRLAEMELRARLLRGILYPTEASVKNARMLMQELRVTLHFPASLAVLSPVDPEENISWAGDLIRQLTDRGLLSPDRDLWGIENGGLVILSGGEELTEKIRNSGLIAPAGRYRAAFGDLCTQIGLVHRSFEQAVVLNAVSSSPFADIRDPENRCRFLLRRTADREDTFLDAYLQKLETAFSHEETETLLQTAEVYYRSSRSVSEAAEKLFIHKNTLQYRLKKLYGALDLTRWPDFRKEYLIRLLLERYKGKQGLRTLL